jgi:hypothetical protein
MVKTGDKTRSAHRVAYEGAFGPIPDGLNVLHRCDVRHCVRPDHLFLGTHAENMKDMAQKGRAVRGVLNHNAKVTPEIVRRIRELHAAGWGAKRLARAFGLNRTTAREIFLGLTWRHVDAR